MPCTGLLHADKMRRQKRPASLAVRVEVATHEAAAVGFWRYFYVLCLNIRIVDLKGACGLVLGWGISSHVWILVLLTWMYF